MDVFFDVVVADFAVEKVVEFLVVKFGVGLEGFDFLVDLGLGIMEVGFHC